MSQKTSKIIAENFLEYLKQENLSEILPDIALLLTREADRRQTITVMSAAELPDKEQKDLSKTLVDKWGEHAVQFTVDETLLSGMIIAFGDKIIDLSGRSKLNDLSQKLS